MSKIFFLFLLSCLITLLSACSFQWQKEIPLAPPLYHLYLQTPDPYGYLARGLEQNLKISKVQLVPTPAEATTILVILNDRSSSELLGVNGTQQTRQYRLTVTVVFQIEDAKGRILINPQTLTEERTITIQSDQILGSSNEANLFYQQMRLALAYAIMNRLGSVEVTKKINFFYPLILPSSRGLSAESRK